MKRHIAGLYFLLGVWFLPIFALVLRALAKTWQWPRLLPKDMNLDPWFHLFREGSTTLQAIGTTVMIALAVILVNLLVAIPAANILGRYAFKGRSLINITLTAPILLPPLALSIGMHRTLIRYGLDDHIIGVIIALIVPTMPYMLRALIVGFESLGFQLEEQAATLGARPLQRLQYVVLPSLLPAVIAGASITTLITISQYASVLLIGGGIVQTLPVVTFPFLLSGNETFGSVYTIVFALLAVLLLLFLEVGLKRYYRKDL